MASEILAIMQLKTSRAMGQNLNNIARIEILKSADIENIAALQPEGWGDILPSIRFYCQSSFCHPLKATIDGNIAGVGTAIIHGTTAWLAHIIVHKDYRNAGIGTTITKTLIDVVFKTACNSVLLIATTLGEPMYRKLGFAAETQYVFLDHGTLPAPAAEKNIVIFHPKYRNALLRLDQRVSGETREKLLDAHFADIKLFLDDDEVIGFYLPTLGEGLIIASDSHAGTELMKHKWTMNKMFCIPVENQLGIDFLKRHGYKEFRKASRMMLGNQIRWDGRQIYSRIGGNLG